MTSISLRTAGLVLLLLAPAALLRAEIVRDLYTANVPVQDQSSAELIRASRAALSEVLVKVSGSERVLQNPVIAEAVSGARSQVQRFSYKRIEDGGGLSARLVFDGDYVTELAITAGVPIWTANRPAVLLWLVREDADGRRFVNADTSPELLSIIRAEFDRRGVPVQIPLYDLADTAALTTEQAWRLTDPSILLASSRYNLQDVLAGRVSSLASGGLLGEWAFLYGDTQTLHSSRVQNDEQFLREGVALAAEAMAARYAVAASGAGVGLMVTVTGVTGYSDYAAIVSWLESLELVSSANVESIQGETISLRVDAQADAAQLASTIELNKRLLPVADIADPGQLSYQWQR